MPGIPATIRRCAPLVGLFLAVLVVHGLSPVDTVTDSRWLLPTALSLVREGNLNLDEYRAAIAPNDWRIAQRDGRLYDRYPAAQAILLAPAMWLVDHGVRVVMGLDLQQVFMEHVVARLQVIFAAVTIALAGVLIYLLALHELGDRRYAVLVWFVFAFCTSAWSSATRAFWQHTPSILLLAAMLLALRRAGQRPGLLLWAGAALGLAVMVRPTNAISALVLGLYVLLALPRRFPLFALGGIVAAAPFVAVNLSIWQAPFPPTYTHWASGSNPLVGLAGTLLSPSRGLLVFSPVFLLSIWGAVSMQRRREDRALAGALAAAIALHWVMISVWGNWWGGGSIGPRLFADMVPYLVFLLIPALPVSLAWSGRFRGPRIAAATVLIVASFAIHCHCATNWSAVHWNTTPVNVDEHPERLWDWRDPQFLRGILPRAQAQTMQADTIYEVS